MFKKEAVPQTGVAPVGLLPPLTGLRFFVVTMLFIFHYNSPALYGSVLSSYFNHFYVCVNIFFVLSGFLITWIYFDATNAGKKNWPEYFLNRFARIIPLFFIITCIQFAVPWYQSGAKEFPWAIFLANITLIKGFSVSFFFTGIYAAWSLTTELLFYILVPVIFHLIRRNVPLIIQVLFFLFLAFMLSLVFDIFPWNGFFDSFKFNWTVTFFGRSFEFYCGIWLALFIKRQRGQPCGLKKIKNISITYGSLTLMVMITILLSVINIRTADDTPQNIPGILVSLYVFPIAVAMFFYGLIAEESFLKRILNSGIVQLLGKGSYAFFLVHTSVIATWISSVLGNSHVLLLFITLYGISILLYLYCEYPLNKLMKKAAKFITVRNQ